MSKEGFENKTVFLTGIKPTGALHLGNYFGAIRSYLQILEKLKTDQPDYLDKEKLNKKKTQSLVYKDFKSEFISLFFIADYHALTEESGIFSQKKRLKPQNRALKQCSYEILASLLALGFDTKETILYRQSDVPEIFELSWILSCYTPKGLMNRTHAYKAKQDLNKKAFRKDMDSGISMGLYSYPILMSSDILLFHADFVPVGKDQIQHVEIARDIAQKFNQENGEILNLPEFLMSDEASWIPGLDGNKMSKSSQNYIPIFCSPRDLKNLISKIKTDSSPPKEPKDPSTSSLFQLYSLFSSETKIREMRLKYKEGISWSEVKESLFQNIEEFIQEPRAKYNSLIKRTDDLEDILQEGAKKARMISCKSLNIVRKTLDLNSK